VVTVVFMVVLAAALCCGDPGLSPIGTARKKKVY